MSRNDGAKFNETKLHEQIKPLIKEVRKPHPEGQTLDQG
jgi:hypothetical protein